MNQTEFARFMTDAQTTFPALSDWFNDRGQGRNLIWKTWFTAMISTDAEAASRAIEQMIANTESQVFGSRWDTFPGLINKLCAKTKRPGNERVRKCELCCGDGIIEVGCVRRVLTVDENEMKTFRHHGVKMWGPFGVACPCSNGKENQAKRELKLREFDKRYMAPIAQSKHQFADQLNEVVQSQRYSLRQASLTFEAGVDGSGFDFDQISTTLAGKFSLPN